MRPAVEERRGCGASAEVTWAEDQYVNCGVSSEHTLLSHYLLLILLPFHCIAQSSPHVKQNKGKTFYHLSIFGIFYVTAKPYAITINTLLDSILYVRCSFDKNVTSKYKVIVSILIYNIRKGVTTDGNYSGNYSSPPPKRKKRGICVLDSCSLFYYY